MSACQNEGAVGSSSGEILQNDPELSMVDDRLERGKDTNELTWDIFYKLEWLREDFPHLFENIIERDDEEIIENT
ncbi:MAG: hypothetical protein IKW30_08610 [Lachnospiraceae bacterium]|nr:hypothetical protein [Lachnospiraceae bacterium]